MCNFLGPTPMPDGRTLGKANLVEHPGIGASHQGLRGDIPGSDGIHRDSSTDGLQCQSFRNAENRLLCRHIAETVRHRQECIFSPATEDIFPLFWMFDVKSPRESVN